ncbi:unnamed protein product, partial [Rotaria sp. Silwood2]
RINLNLSGGQQQRVSLARVLYSNADIVLLNDSLSTVEDMLVLIFSNMS